MCMGIKKDRSLHFSNGKSNRGLLWLTQIIATQNTFLLIRTRGKVYERKSFDKTFNIVLTELFPHDLNVSIKVYL